MSLSTLEQWYASQCNGDWEHAHDVKIGTLDNPGWYVSIDLRETRKNGVPLDRIRIDRAETDWMQYWVENYKFEIRCGPLNLSEAIELFAEWFNSGPGYKSSP